MNELAHIIAALEQKLDKLKSLSGLAQTWDASALHQADDLLEKALHGLELTTSTVLHPMSSAERRQADMGSDDDFLIREGLDLLTAYRAIKDTEVRSTILTMIAAVSQSGSIVG